MNKQVIAVGLLALSCAAGAQSLKPGLWEVTQKTQAGGQMNDAMAQMQKEMANMPPDQRKMVEAMMARQGAGMGGGGAGMTVKMCMTKEMVERNQVTQPPQGDCKTTVQPRSGNTMKMSFSCANPPSSGEGQMTFTSPEAYSMKMKVNTTAAGQPQKVSMDTSARWLGADCGNIKPVAAK
ncbi:DUF3617 domain-containing protein [Ramlibacter solisilvae]|uniref:DUF3617 domain-containing protein n=1 Tax=Ramlibacter tataouinensis TaxID=94132 RepID=A0A127JU31_9BURK|nr:DUF3617 domain-containing protein [Ramlibacter tataouinensis]AMO23477.1 hypothetical protein UC35_11915 [Ramlibacter tataouinensis]